jgi:hypothetical protein
MPDVLVAVVRLDRPTVDHRQLRLLAERDGSTIELKSRWLACEEGIADRAPATWLLAAAVPPAADDVESRRLLLEDADRRTPLATEPLASQLEGIVDFVEGGLRRLDAEVRNRVVSFLNAAPSAHGIKPNPELSARLATVRDMLREPLTVTAVEPGAGPAVRLEKVLTVDDQAYLLCGWLHDGAPYQAQFTVVTPEGKRIEPLEGTISWHPRPDVDRAFEGDATRNIGFQIYVELDRAIHYPEGWLVEVRTAAGYAIETTAPSSVTSDPTEVRRRVMSTFGGDSPDPAVFANHTLPALKRLRIGSEIRVEHIASYGEVPRAPEISIITALRQIDRIEHQLLQYAGDPELRRAELIFVLPPASAQAMRTRAPHLEELYGIPFRVVELSGGARRPRAMNLGASVARGRLLLFMGGDVFPVEPGWLGRMCELLDAQPRVGAAGPRLLHSDGSIAHVATTYVAGQNGKLWERALPFKGLGPTIPPVQGPRPVQALSYE